MIRKFAKILISIISLLTILPVKVLYAADFENDIEIQYSVNADGKMHIKETKKIYNNSSKYYISTDSFVISSFKTRSKITKEDLEKIAKTIILKNEHGEAINFDLITHENSLEIRVKLGPSFKVGQKKVFILEYESFELAEKSGNVWNIYIPGMPSDYTTEITSEIGSSSAYRYKILLELDKSLGKPNFVLPEPISVTSLNNKNVYEFSIDSLLDSYGWIQIGEKQYYSFEITQPVSTSSNLGVFYVYYDLVLPRESKNQKVYFDYFSHTPLYIKIDGEGNVIARFKFTNQEKTTIQIKGYIEVNVTEEVKREEVGKISDINLEEIYANQDGNSITFKDLLKSAEYWEVENEKIQKIALDLKGEKTNVYDILLSDYNFIIKNVDYDELKTGIRNKRQGALKTLEGNSSVCMEYSDLLITLLRAQGIPARAAFGYGFDPKSELESREGHQWVEVYMPNIGWIAVDPTWGDTGRKNYIGGDVDHALWKISSINVDTPSPVTKYSILDDNILEPPSFVFNVVESIKKENLVTLESLLKDYPFTQKHIFIEKFEQLNSYGKVIFIGIPSLLILILILIIFSTILKKIKQ